MPISARRNNPHAPRVAHPSLALLALALCVAAAHAAHADVPPAVGVGAAAAPVQSSRLAEAVRAYEAGELVEARALFEELHAEAPSARTLRSLGLVAFRQARYREALVYLDASLESDVKPLDGTLRSDAQALRADAKAALDADSSLPATPAQAEVLPLAIAPSTASAPAPRIVEPSVAAPERARPLRARRLKRAGYTLLGVGAGALLLSLTSAALALRRLHDTEAACDAQPAGGCSVDQARALERENHFARLATIARAGLGLGASALSASGLVFYFGQRAAAVERAPHAGIVWRGRF